MTSKMIENILILGGTSQAENIAVRLVNQGHNVTTSLAGRTKRPKQSSGKVRIGGFSSKDFDGVEGLSQFILANKITRLIDATHPFALQISKNAVAAAAMTGIALEVCSRPPWQRKLDDQWIEVENTTQAAKIIPKNARVFLALGSQYIDVFQSRPDVFFLVRMIDSPNSPLPLANYTLEIGKPKQAWQNELELFQKNNIDHLICRNSGGDKGYAKIIAARQLGIQVIILDHPNAHNQY